MKFGLDPAASHIGLFANVHNLPRLGRDSRLTVSLSALLRSNSLWRQRRRFSPAAGQARSAAWREACALLRARTLTSSTRCCAPPPSAAYCGAGTLAGRTPP